MIQPTILIVDDDPQIALGLEAVLAPLAAAGPDGLTVPVVHDAVLDGHLQPVGEGEGPDRKYRVTELQQLQGFRHGAHRPAPLS